MTTRTDADLLAYYGITEPPVGSVWTWHTPQGHRVTAVATHSPTDRLGRAGGIPTVGGRQLEDHPANVGILAGIFREHVCATAYAMLVLDPDGTAPARWTVCDGAGRTTTPALTEFGAWHWALTHNADPDCEGPWVSGVSLEHNLAAIGRYNADRWKTEAERQTECADIATAGLVGAAQALRLDTDRDVEALGDAVVTAIREQLAISRPAVETLGSIAALVGIRDLGDGSPAQAVDQIHRHLTAVAVALDHGPGADCTMQEAAERMRDHLRDITEERHHFKAKHERLRAEHDAATLVLDQREFGESHGVLDMAQKASKLIGRLRSMRAVICADLGLDHNDDNADIAGAIEALKGRTVERIMEKAGPIKVAPMPVPDDIDRDEAEYHTVDGVPLTDIIDARTHLLGLLDLEWDASADDVAAGAARLSRILRGPVADAEAEMVALVERLRKAAGMDEFKAPEWVVDESVKILKAHAAGWRPTITDPAAEVTAAKDAAMQAESQADVLRAALYGLLGEFRALDGDDVPDLVQAAVQLRKRMVGALDTILTRIDGEHTEGVGMTVMRVQDCADEMERCIKDGATVDGLSNTITTLEQRLTVMEAERDHLAAWHRGPDPVAMAALWEHDPAHATELLHPVFRLVSLYLWTGSERAKDAEHLFPGTADARGASEPGAAVVRLIDGRAVVRLDVDGTDYGLWTVGDWVRDSLRTALTMHPGVWALLGAAGPVSPDMIRLEDVVPF